MTFQSILFYQNSPKRELEQAAPVFFADLHLDQVIDAITTGKEEYDLKPFFYTSISDRTGILYRQEIMRDLEDAGLLDILETFAQRMFVMRRSLPKEKVYYYKYERERLFLDAVEIYCETVQSLSDSLSHVAIESSGLQAFREYLAGYIQSIPFTSLLADTQKLLGDLSSIKYCVLAGDSRVQVRHCNGEPDYSTEIEQLFEKFKQDAVKDYRMKFPADAGMNSVEARILEGVAALYPAIFQDLDSFCVRHADYQDRTIAVFDREIQFYISYLGYIRNLTRSGLKFCYPEISSDKEVYDHEGFDIALANKLVKENAPVVCNDLSLNGKERIMIVTGPNQGGKTTFSRTFGQLHYLAGIGCPVPGSKAKLFLYDKLFTHFEKEENVKNLRSKLEDDLVRMHDTLARATSNSIIIMNEVLSSTTLQDAIFLSKKVMEKIAQLDLLCVWVTFIDELASLSDKTVSMMSMVAAENTALRTFKIVRRQADGLAYALSIAEKYGVTYNRLSKRLPL
jgi:hypothetical protein